jgi:hypothetical protein
VEASSDAAFARPQAIYQTIIYRRRIGTHINAFLATNQPRNTSHGQENAQSVYEELMKLITPIYFIRLGFRLNHEKSTLNRIRSGPPLNLDHSINNSPPLSPLRDYSSSTPPSREWDRSDPTVSNKRGASPLLEDVFVPSTHSQALTVFTLIEISYEGSLSPHKKKP